MQSLRLIAITSMAAFATVASADGPPLPADTLAGSLTGISDALTTYMAVLAGASGLAVALLEAFKKLFSVRGRFHRAAVILWLSQDKSQVPESLRPATTGPLTWASTICSFGRTPHYSVRSDKMADLELTAGVMGDFLRHARGEGIAITVPRRYQPDDAYAEFFHLTTGQRLPTPLKPRSDWVNWRGIDRAVFELDIARLMSQVQEAADAVLNSPTLYPNLYAFFTRGSSQAEAGTWWAYVEATKRVRPGGQAGGDSNATGSVGAEDERERSLNLAPTKELSDLNGRIRLLMRRQLDAFQCVTSNRWDELNQLWAVIVGAAILLCAQLIMLNHTDIKNPTAILPYTDLVAGAKAAMQLSGEAFIGLLLKTALGGALAPIAKDLLSSLSSLRFTK